MALASAPGRVAVWWPSQGPPTLVLYRGQIEAGDAQRAMIGANTLVCHADVFVPPASRPACSFAPRLGNA